MPYIKKEQRAILNPSLRQVAELFDDTTTPGDLNYIFYMLSLAYIRRKGEKYQHYNDIIGALEGCKLELYRQHIASYENKKIDENGNI